MAEREVNPEVIEQERLANELGKSLLEILKEQARERGRFNQETKHATDLAKELSKFTRDDLKSSRKRAKFQQKVIDARAEQINLEKKIAQILDKVGGKVEDLSEEEAVRLGHLQKALETSRETVEEARLLAKEYRLIDSITAGFDMFGNAVNDIPVIREAFKEFSNASKEFTDSMRAGEGFGRSFAAGSKELAKGGAKAGIGALIFQLLAGTKVLEDFGNKLINILQIPGQDEDVLKTTFEDLSNQLGAFDIDDVVVGIQTISQQLGTATVQSNEFTRAFLTLTDRLGISAEATGNIAKFAAVSGDEFRGVTTEVIGLVAEMNDVNDLNLRFGDILNDIGNSSAATLLTVQKFPGGIAKAAFEARKFGLTLGQLENTSESLLNFQSSIESELEAELLTGRRLNLEQARMAALMGDQTKLAEEIAKNVGTAEEFAGMNVIQQEALAKAFGMSRKELAQTLLDRESLLELEKTSRIEGLAGMKQEERIAAMTAKYQEDGMDAASARSRALRELGEEELDRQEKALSFQQELGKTFKDLTVALGKLTEALNVDLMEGLLKSIEGFTAMIEGIRTQGFLGYVFGGDKDLNPDGTIKSMSELRADREAEKKAAQEIEKAKIKAETDSLLSVPMDPSQYKTEEISPGTYRYTFPTQDNTTALIEEIKGLRDDLGTGKLKLSMDGRIVGETLATNYTAFS